MLKIFKYIDYFSEVVVVFYIYLAVWFHSVSACYLFHSGLLLGLFFDPEMEAIIPPKLRVNFNGLHGDIIETTEFFN
jgi:hypothetical protein